MSASKELTRSIIREECNPLLSERDDTTIISRMA